MRHTARDLPFSSLAWSRGCCVSANPAGGAGGWGAIMVWKSSLTLRVATAGELQAGRQGTAGHQSLSRDLPAGLSLWKDQESAPAGHGAHIPRLWLSL